MQTIITNARLILEDEVVDGSLLLEGDRIVAAERGRSHAAGALDAEGDYLAPGLIEMHTDNMEKHFMPRPQVFWPNGLAAALAHDAQMAAAGVTTVYDAICAGTVAGQKDFRREIFPQMIEAVTEGTRAGVFRADHRIHIRAELTGDHVVEETTPFVDHPLVGLVSLMDHTPGQRQWRNLAHLKTYTVGGGEQSDSQHDKDVRVRMELGPRNVERNWPLMVEMLRARGLPIATHDDTTEQDVDLAVLAGAAISEFPTTEEAARAAHAKGLKTVMGGPNIVRGGSHSGGASAASLAEKGLLDGVSSDYVPSSLLQSVLTLSEGHGIRLPEAMGKVTWRIADMLSLGDRGRLAAGLRADVLQFRVVNGTPVVRSLWSAGRRSF